MAAQHTGKIYRCNYYFQQVYFFIYSETTPMISRRTKHNFNICSYMMLLFAILGVIVLVQFLFFSLWLPSIKFGISLERHKFDLELEQRRSAESKRQDRERLREERWQREEEGRQKLGLYWDFIEPAEHCMAYNTRTYDAHLLSANRAFPYEYNWLEACKQMPNIIHGKSMKPNECEYREGVSICLPSKDRDLQALVGSVRTLACELQRTQMCALVGSDQGHGTSIHSYLPDAFFN